jgi:hypothetical protein
MKIRFIGVLSCGLLLLSGILAGCRSVDLVEYGTPNLVVNGDFSGGMANWWDSHTNGADASISVADGALHVVLVHQGRYPSDIMIGQSAPGLECLNGSRYRLSFEAWSTKAYVQLTSAIAENGRDVNHDGFNWSAFSQARYDVTRSRKTFSSTFRMKGTEPNARITFFCGMIDADVFIDNVSFVRVPGT